MDTKKLQKHTKKMGENRNARIAELKSRLGLDQQPPEGWLTAKQIAKRMNCVPRNALNQIHYWSDQGKCKVWKFKAKTLSEWKLIPHYKFDPEVSKALGL